MQHKLHHLSRSGKFKAAGDQSVLEVLGAGKMGKHKDQSNFDKTGSEQQSRAVFSVCSVGTYQK